MGKDKLRGHTKGTFAVLRRTTRTFVIQQGEMVERVNSDRVVNVPGPDTANTRMELEETPEDLVKKNSTEMIV